MVANFFIYNYIIMNMLAFLAERAQGAVEWLCLVIGALLYSAVKYTLVSVARALHHHLRVVDIS